MTRLDLRVMDLGEAYNSIRKVTLRGIILKGRNDISNTTIMEGKLPLLQHLMSITHQRCLWSQPTDMRMSGCLTHDAHSI